MTTFSLSLGEMQSMKGNKGNAILLTGFIALAVGLATGLLVSPKSGKIMRGVIVKKYRDAKKSVMKLVDDVVSSTAPNDEKA